MDPENSDFRISVWTNSEVSSDIVTAQHPLALYAQVSRGTANPVVGARVELEVTVTTGNGTENVQTVRLFDNGNGGEMRKVFNRI